MKFKITLLCVCIGFTANAQKMVRDTSFIAFGDSVFSEVPIKINSVKDNRVIKDGYVSTCINKKYLVIPVDNYFVTKNNLNENIGSLFNSEASISNNLYAEIIVNEFEIKEHKGYIKKNLILNANLETKIKDIVSSDSCSGTLIYESYLPLKGRKQETIARVKTIQNWQTDFIKDMEIISLSLNGNNELPDNFHQNQYNLKTNLLGSLDFIMTYDSYIIEGNLFFSKPEASKQFLRYGHSFRYRHAENFESIGFGRKAAHRIIRGSDKLVFDIGSSFVIAVNKWNDYKEVKHKLEEIVTFDYSLSQKVVYNPLNKNSLTIGVGLVENVYYIINYDLVFRPCLLLSVGLKI